MSMNEHLAAVLDIAEQIQSGHPTGRESPASVIRYAVLKRLEEELGLPVLVKYGDAGAVKASMGIENHAVWDAVPDSDDYSLLRVEVEGDLGVGDRDMIDRTMLAVGAWYVGDAGTKHQEAWMHRLYVFPEDAPVTEMVPEPA